MLRDRVRQVLAHGAEPLPQLAALDAAFSAILLEREGKVLARIPSLLESRFNSLLQQYRDPAAAASARLADGTWLAPFCADIQSVLLAELDLRLQPVRGLIEALNTKKVVFQ